MKYFEDTLSEKNLREVRVYRWIIAGLVTVMIGQMAALIYMTPLKRTEVKLMVADKNTGLPTEITSLADFETGNLRKMTSIEALNKFFTQQYIIAHDSYNHYAVREAYATVQLYSTAQVFADYQKKFEKPNSIQDQLGNRRNLEITVNSITQEQIPTPFKDKDVGVTMRARVEKVIREGDSVIAKNSGTVIMTFGYDADLDMDERARNNNPLGFTVTSYRFTPDMVTGAAEGGTDGNTPLAAEGGES